MNDPVRHLLSFLVGTAAICVLLVWTTPAVALAQSEPVGPTLGIRSAAQMALDHHPATRQAAAEVNAAEADVRVARAPLFPTFSISGSTIRFQEPMVVAPLHAFDPMRPPSFDQTLVRGALQATYTLFDGGARGAARGRAESGSASARASVAVTQSDVLAAVVGAYVDVQAARASVRAADAQLAALTAEHARAERVFREGAAPRVQVLRASAAREEARASLGGARARLSAAEHDLARLTGLAATDVSASSLDPLEPSSVDPDPNAADVGASPRLEGAKQRLEMARAGERAARSQLFPKVQGLVAFQEFGSGDGGFEGEWQAGIQLSYPLFTGGANRAGLDRARAVSRSAEASVEGVELELLRALDRTIAAHAEASGRRPALAAAIEQYEEVARIEALSLAEGAGVQRDLLAAEAELFRARSTLARVEAALTRSTVEIARIRGTLTFAWITENLESSP